MFTITVETTFSATHQLKLHSGALEPRHGHDWIVRAYFTRADLDDHGMVLDFEEARETLNRVVGELHHTDLADHPGFAGLNPTAEVVAKHVFDRIRGAAHTVLRRVEVVEAPNCVACYEPPSASSGAS